MANMRETDSDHNLRQKQLLEREASNARDAFALANFLKHGQIWMDKEELHMNHKLSQARRTMIITTMTNTKKKNRIIQIMLPIIIGV